MRDLKQRLFDLLRSGGNNNNNNNNNNSHNNNSVGCNQNNQNGIPHIQHTIQQLPAAQKPKKLHEYTAADCNAAFLRKYHDLSISRGMGLELNGRERERGARDRGREKDRDRERELEWERERERQLPHGGANVIYFNENLSMASKYNVRQFPLTRYPSCPLSSFGLPPSPHDGHEGHEGHAGLEGHQGSAGSSLGEEEEEEEEDTESERYNFCSDEDQSSNTQTLKIRHSHDMDLDADGDVEGDGDVDVEDDRAESQLDSFCTLCTSTFSYNKCCRFCENSLCGSKCNSERGSHASRISRNGGYPQAEAETDLEQHHQQQQQQQQQQHQLLQQHRFGGSSRMLSSYQPTALRNNNKSGELSRSALLWGPLLLALTFLWRPLAALVCNTKPTTGLKQAATIVRLARAALHKPPPPSPPPPAPLTARSTVPVL
ncbi:GL19881 [Drosophila persimilis]|uniref:GL19881 n=1 Tax=Drosophila persimilis TaxID=7234 RepID=B4GYA6_DROPE|nr:GL19881 [Drosophila persimilis]